MRAKKNKVEDMLESIQDQKKDIMFTQKLSMTWNQSEKMSWGVGV